MRDATAPIPDSYWVEPDRLLAGEYPGARKQAEAREKLDALLDAGVRAFVDLTESHELTPYHGLLQELGEARGTVVTYRRMSVPDLGTPSIEHMENVLRHIESEIQDGRPVYVHCWGGIGRTGTVVGCWMVEKHGSTAEDALQRIADLRRGTPDGYRQSPETPAQREFVMRWGVIAPDGQAPV